MCGHAGANLVRAQCIADTQMNTLFKFIDGSGVRVQRVRI